ncbi:MAG TPA: hypothetical protein VHD33_01280 [Legionellaceae bacterium]|nr:hypothetical protein [Legionellaceae bacterium]
MALMEQVLEICQRYAGRGWGRYLKDNFGLDINQPTVQALARELNRNLGLNASHLSIPGFDDLDRNTQRGIERGNPARSLLYHAFSSPSVLPFEAEECYLEASELDILENFIWVASQNGIDAPSYQTLVNTKIKTLLPFRTDPKIAVVIFSQEYRQGHESSHRRHADLAFSRTGVARVGTKEALYSRKDRGYWPSVQDEPKSIRVLPAKYAPYLAVALTGNARTFGPLAMQDSMLDAGDEKRAFWVPVHKLFPSKDECIKDLDLQDLKLEAHHVNEKIRRVHLAFRDKDVVAETNSEVLSQAPYFITQNLATIDTDGQLFPVAAPLVQIARNAHGERVTFEVPRKNIDFFDNSTLNIAAGDDGSRSAPEYLHVRRTAGNTEAADIDENTNPDMSKALLKGTDENPRRAVHYIDSTADGWITLERNNALRVLSNKELNILPAYSLVTAPDFYPLVTQYQLMRWHNTQARRVWFPRVNPPEPDVLSNQRFAANINLMQDAAGNPVPQTGSSVERSVFNLHDDTITAIISLPIIHEGPIFDPTISLGIKRHNGLPDAASGVFAPGWDISFDVTQGDNHLAAYGLGSPFPEDAKLCAALSSFWPAAAPDTSITFNITNSGILNNKIQNRIIIPMTIEEITGAYPWDGVQGPRISKVNGTEIVTYPRPDFVDYVKNAENGAFSLAKTSELTLNEYIQRIIVQQRVNDFLNSSQIRTAHGVLYKDYHMLSFYKENGKFHYEFAEVGKVTQYEPPEITPSGRDHRFFNAPITNRFAIEIGQDNVPQLVTPKPI